MPVASPYDSRDARLTASVVAGPSMKPMPGPGRITNQSCLLNWRSVTLPAQRAKPTAASAQPSDDRPLGSDAIEHPPADLGGDTNPRKKYSSTRLASDGDLPEADLGVLAGEEEDGDEDDHRDPEYEVLDQEGADAEDADVHQR